MKVLVVGGGGREHALCWKIAKSPLVKKLYCAPGNGGTAEVAENLDVRQDDLNALYKFAKQEKVDLTVVGPEAVLAAGIVDRLEQGGLKVFGPSARAARLEASKVFAKTLMRKHALPTAEYKIFSKADEAQAYLAQAHYPLVVKADGLAQGKGVVVAATFDQAMQHVRRCLVDKELGEAGAKVIVEEALKGEEMSVLALTDAHAIMVLEDARDHKRLRDGDEGPNTGGMGAYSPSGLATQKNMEKIESKVLVPIVHAMKREEHPFRGCLYAGLMLTNTGPKVLEFNCRFGDPETQAILPRMRSDLLPLLLATVDGTLEERAVEWDPRPSVTVVMASAGYPGAVKTGVPVTGVERAAAKPDVVVFHAGTRREGPAGNRTGPLVTAGGRVLAVTALGSDIAEARRRAYDAVKEIRFEGAHCRTDIGLAPPTTIPVAKGPTPGAVRRG
jgi:phosphoribosylamine--glycine ligase